MKISKENRRFICVSFVLAALLCPLVFTSCAEASGLGAKGGDPMSYPASAMGKIIETVEGQQYYCTGSVVTTPGKATVVMTAGHCVINELTGKKAGQILFIPGYQRGATPYGVWEARSFKADPEWNPKGGLVERSGDVAFVTLKDRKGMSLKALTGSIGIGFGQAPEQTYTDWAYPQLKPYDGEELFRTTGDLVEQSEEGEWVVPTLGIRSDYTEGSSGGPWTIGPESAPVAVSLNSYVNYGHDGLIWGPQFDSGIEALFRSVGGDPANAGPAASKRLHLKLWAHARRHGSRTTVIFGVKGGRGISIGYICRSGGRVHGCLSGMTVRSGQRVTVQAFYDAPAYRRVVGQVSVVGPRV